MIKTISRETLQHSWQKNDCKRFVVADVKQYNQSPEKSRVLSENKSMTNLMAETVTKFSPEA